MVLVEQLDHQTSKPFESPENIKCHQNDHLKAKNKTTLENVKNENHMDGQQNGGLEAGQGP